MSQNTLRAWAETGKIPMRRNPANGYRLFLRRDLEQYLARVARNSKRFRVGRDGIEGVYSDGSFTVKFRVETSAQTQGQQAAVVASLNDWLSRTS